MPFTAILVGSRIDVDSRPTALPPKEVEIWVTSQWKFMPLVGQI